MLETKGWKCLPMFGNSNDLRNVNLKRSTNEFGNAFVGIKVYNNKVDFHYPESYEVDYKNETQMKSDILALLKAISGFKKFISEERTSDPNFSHDSELALNTYIWIINDYLNNGIYYSSEKVLRTNTNGKVNWKKTLKGFPLITESSIYYPNFITEKTDALENILSEIYKFCCEVAFRNIGWLFNAKLTHRCAIPYNRNYFISIIESAQHSAFDDKKKILLLNLKRIIQGLSDDYSEKDIYVFGVDNFEFVFEYMIDSVFGNIDRKSEYYPSGEWQLVGYKDKYKTSNLRPDTIIDDHDDIYIIDSKYYRFGTTKNILDLPETTSIQKQITYGEYIMNVKKIRNVHNVFVLPFNKLDYVAQANRNIQYFGRALPNWIGDDKTVKVISGFLIDLKYLVNLYNLHSRNRSEEFISQYKYQDLERI